VRRIAFVLFVSVVLLSTAVWAGDDAVPTNRTEISGLNKVEARGSLGSKADVPRLISYQGTLTDPAGVVLDTTVMLMFNIYIDSTGMLPVWTEHHPAVTVENGVFNVLLGRVMTIPVDVFSDPERWLGVQVGGDAELEPRQRIAAVPYAFWAAEADTAEYARSAPAAGIDSVMYADSSGYAPMPDSVVHAVYADTSDHAVSAKTDGDWTVSGSDMYSAVSGNLGIGLSSPAAKLDVKGAVNADSVYMIWGNRVLYAGYGNTLVGAHAGDSTIEASSANWNTFVGEYAGAYHGSGHKNTFVGHSAGQNTDGSDNTFLGYSAGFSNTSGAGNVFLGNQAGRNELGSNKLYIANDNDSGSVLIYGEFDNGRIGLGTLSPQARLDVAGTVSTDSVYQIGGSTVLSVEGDRSLSVGIDAGTATPRAWNTFVGDSAGVSNQGDNNTFLGAHAGQSNTTGSDNTFLGKVAGKFNTEGALNTFVGSQSGTYSTGDLNVFVGMNTGMFTTGDGNTFVGGSVGNNNTTGQTNTFIGNAVGAYNTTGWSNTYIGVGAGSANTTGHKNVFLGAHAGCYETGSEKLYIANDADTASVLIYGEFDTGKIGMGSLAPEERLHVAGDVKVDSTLQTMGFKMPTGASNGYVLTSDGSGAGAWQTPAAVSDGDWTISGSDMYSAVSGNVGIGTSSPGQKLHIVGANPRILVEASSASPEIDLMSTGDPASEVWAIYKHVGTDDLHFYQVGEKLTIKNGTGDVGIGKISPVAKLDVAGMVSTDSVYQIGGSTVLSVKGSNNVFVGVDAGKNNAIGDNTFVGAHAGSTNTTGRHNAFFGADAGRANTEGSYNTFMGEDAGFSNTTGIENTFLGADAGMSGTLASYNTFLGSSVGHSITTGGSNVFVGYESGGEHTTGNGNTFLGTYAGGNNITGIGNVLLGYMAGYSESGSEKLYIANNLDTASVLIYGEFDNGRVGLGTLTPAERLDVAGTVQMTGFKMPTGASNGHVLTSDGSGAGTWQAATGGADGDWTIAGSNMYSAVSGNVGIGSSTPDVKLTVEGPTDAMVLAKINQVGGRQYVGLRLDRNDAETWFVGMGNLNDRLVFRRSASSDDMAIDTTGNVGIGTLAPAEKLDVVGTAKMAGFKMPTGASSGYVLTSDGSGMGTWQAAGADGDWTISGSDVYSAVSGNVGIGTSTPDAKLTIESPTDWNTLVKVNQVGSRKYAGLRLDRNDAETWFVGMRHLNDRLVFRRSASSNDMVIDTTGNVGIGTGSSAPEAQLHVDASQQYAGLFESDSSSSDTKVLRAEYTGTGSYDAVAVYGEAAATDYFGYGGFFVGGYMGVYGKVSPTGTDSYWGVRGDAIGGSGTNYGVDGYAYGSGTNYGVFGDVGGGSTNYAGYFNGLLHATTATASVKAFKIDHPLDPENRYLYHSSVESPDMMNVYNGNAVLDARGEAWVSLPEYFQALNRDFRYQLTCIGGFAPVYVAEEISGNRFQIAGGDPGMKISWQVTGIRHDPVAQAGRIEAETMKPASERGKYLNPEAYGQPESMGVGYVDREKIKMTEEID